MAIEGSDLHQTYIDTVLNPVLEDMVTSVLTHKPKDVTTFMIDYLRQKRGDDVSTAEKEELRLLRAEVARLKEAKVADSASEGSSYVSDEDDYVDDLPVASTYIQKERPSVSAEAFGAWNKKEDFTPRVIDKPVEKKASIHNRLSQAFMFEALDEKEREIVVMAMEERTASAGDFVINQGEDGAELFVVDSGVLECYKTFNKGEDPKYLKDYNPGDAFGELALLYNAPRAASIKAKTDCVLWVLDRECFNNIVKDSSSKKREKYEAFLSKVELLEDMDPYERLTISDAFKPVNFAAGEYVIREGEWGDIFYLLVDGEAKATKTLTPGQPPEEVKSYSPGDYFGELALLRGEPRAANIVAKTKLSCITLDRHAFKRMLGPLDEILQRNAAKYENILKK